MSGSKRSDPAPRQYGRLTEEELAELLHSPLPWLSLERRRVFWGLTGDVTISELRFQLSTHRIKTRVPGEKRIRRWGDAGFGWRRGEDQGGFGSLRPAIAPEAAGPLSDAELGRLVEQSGEDWLADAAPHAPRWMKPLILKSDFIQLSITYIGQNAIFLDGGA